jgi:hypothetical protein
LVGPSSIVCEFIVVRMRTLCRRKLTVHDLDLGAQLTAKRLRPTGSQSRKQVPQFSFKCFGVVHVGYE